MIAPSLSIRVDQLMPTPRGRRPARVLGSPLPVAGPPRPGRAGVHRPAARARRLRRALGPAGPGRRKPGCGGDERGRGPAAAGRPRLSRCRSRRDRGRGTRGSRCCSRRDPRVPRPGSAEPCGCRARFATDRAAGGPACDQGDASHGAHTPAPRRSAGPAEAKPLSRPSESPPFRVGPDSERGSSAGAKPSSAQWLAALARTRTTPS